MKYALITGGSRGIGRAICLRVARMGYVVIINYVSNAEAAHETKAAIEKEGGAAELLPFDVTKRDQVEAAILQWEEAHPGEYISVLVNNAGIRKDGVMALLTDDDWHSVLDTSVTGSFYVTRLLLRHMLPRKRTGKIVNMASLSGLKGLPGQANYSAAKSALIGMTKALAQEVAPRGVTVNAIAPGFIETDMTADLNEEELRKQIPLGRFGTPEEVAGLVAFLISDDAAYITGEVISINGGLYS